MRITNEPEFCSVCIEGLWMSLLSRVDPIDRMDASCAFDETTGKWTRTLALELVDLTKSGAYELEWQKDGVTVPAWADQSTVEIAGDEEGSFEVFVRFLTEEIRLDPNGYTRSNATFIVGSPCPA